ncbi:MAG: NADH-quinone oxidoreductase subunit M [Opitutaceae bacterium]
MNDLPLLTLIVFLPWVGALLLWLWPKAPARALSLVFSASTLVLAGVAATGFDPAVPGYQWVERHAWIVSLQVDYHLGVDGMGLLMVILTGLVSPLALTAVLRRVEAPRLAALLFLLLQGAALGVFVALDFFPWFVFWELSLVPAFFLIKVWGGAGAGRAAYTFVVTTLAGSAGLLLGFAALYAATGTMNFADLARLQAEGRLVGQLSALGAGMPTLVFLGVLVGLAVKAPLFPLHTWMPPTYAEAPAGVAMFLTAVMSKMGVYGFFRILWPLFPEALRVHADVLVALALGGAVLGAMAALRQTDIRRMLAYSSLNHVSYCLIALFAAAAGVKGQEPAVEAALTGALVQAFNHGLSASALFFCAGVLESRAGGSREFSSYGGVRTVAPLLAGVCGISLFSSLGLPGLNGFVGEFLVFRGVFGLYPWVAAIGTIGLLATALFLLTFWQRVFHGPRAGAAAGAFADLDGGERAVLVPLCGVMLILGVMPGLVTSWINPLVVQWAATLPMP